MADLIAHLLRRAGFGATPAEHAAYAARGFEASVEELVNFEAVDDGLPDDPSPDAFAEGRGNLIDLSRWWVRRLLGSKRPLQEKLTLFWHGHFATANYKVNSPELMYRQNLLLRAHALGNFRDLLWEVTVDPAMLIWLDGTRNKKGAPNENYARELMELFSLGLGNYTEDDVKQAARALTGWVIQEEGKQHLHASARFNRNQFDAGAKSLFGRSGNLQAKDVIDLAASHSAAGPFLATKLYTFFVAPTPNPQTLDRVADLYYRSGYDLRAMVRALLLSDDFQSDAAYRANIASPAEFVLGTLKRFGLTDLKDDQLNGVIGGMRRLGQFLFNPPTVKGWDGGAAWIDTNTMLERFNVANALVNNRAARDVGIGGLLAEAKREAATADEVVEWLNRRLLGGDMPDRLRAPLRDYLTTWSEGPVAFRLDERTLDRKVRGAVRLVLASQSYQRN